MTNRADTFDRADTTSNIGTPSDAGSAWVQNSGTWGITGNTGYESAGGANNVVCSLESSVADVDIQVTVTGNAATVAGIVARLADDNNYLLFQIDVVSGKVRFYKRVAGTFTQIGTDVVFTYVAGDVYKFSLSGTTITGYQNGVSLITNSSSDGQTNTKHGLYSNNGFGRFNYLTITGAGGGGGGVTLPELERGIRGLNRGVAQGAY